VQEANSGEINSGALPDLAFNDRFSRLHYAERIERGGSSGIFVELSRLWL
jgi:hypothetical protein